MSDNDEIMGRVCCRSTSFQWTFPVNQLEKNHRVSRSPYVKCFQNDWYLEIWGNFKLIDDTIGIQLARDTASSMPPVWFTIAVQTSKGLKIISDGSMTNKLRTSTATRPRKADLLERTSPLTPLDTLTFVFTLNDKPPSTEGGAIQQKHFKDMLLQGGDHDVTLKVKGKEFKAHKNILRARSPVFSATFTHNMKEAECGDVTIEDCDSNSFGEFLEYVYTGKVDNLTPSNASGLYYAADKYDFPDLKKTCVEFLKTSLSPNVVCDVIEMAMRHGEKELQDYAMEFFTEHLKEIWQTVEWQRFLESNCTLAIELNTKAMESYSYSKNKRIRHS